MDIDAKKLHEVLAKRIRLVSDDERFYSTDDSERYALSTYGRLYQRCEDAWHKVPIGYRRGEGYWIDGEFIRIETLIGNVFFSNKKYIIIYNGNNNVFDARRWDVRHLFVLDSQDELVEVLQAKMDNRQPVIDESKFNHRFINRVEFDAPLYSVLRSKYQGMKSRATNPHIKKLHPNYMDVSMSPEWIDNPDAFYSFFLERQYYYPGDLSIDKDLLAIGQNGNYFPENVTMLPNYLNLIFQKSSSRLGYCIVPVQTKNGTTYVIQAARYSIKGEHSEDMRFTDYRQALEAGRKKKAEYIRKLASKEKGDGYLPEYLIEAMQEWADLCEHGKVKIWEPSDEVLREMGIKGEDYNDRD